MSEQYKNYSKQDFLEDAYFIAYVRNRGVDAVDFWTAWMAAEPANLASMKAAEQELRLLLTVKRIYPPAGLADEVWNHISSDIVAANERKLQLRVSRRKWLAAAAVGLLVLGSAGMLKYLGNKTVTTGYGKTVSIVLSDESRIILNANSTLTYAKHWWSGSRREVWLSGEAFFEVVHLKNDSLPVKEGERFVVHTPNLDVEVLGTVFNVKERRGITKVGLTYGSVKVKLKDNSTALQLLPGEQASYDPQTHQLQKAAKDMSEVNAWKDNKLVMNNASVGEIIHLLEDTYGYKAVLEDPAIVNKRIEGTIPVKNEDNIIFILSGILKVNIEKKDSLLIFRRTH
ncbi:FecR family protein [Chitinophaga sp. RAB17]|uniref:FecR family protein n=1 Tax=Chitinophaga sp. RAB17 TaxID=3233049 RepID=UPI003F935875